MNKLFIDREWNEFVKVVEKMYKEEEGLTITNCAVLEGINITNCGVLDATEYELDFFESCGGGFSSVGSFTIPMEELHKRINMFETIPLQYNRGEFTSAIDSAWAEKKNILIYPKDMDLIVVDVPREDHCYLKKTSIVEACCYNSKEEFENEIKELLAS